MDLNEPAIIVRRASAWMWFLQICILLGTFSALGLSIAMFLSDDLGESMLAEAESKNGRLLSLIPAPGPAIILLVIGVYGAFLFFGGIGVLLGTKPVLFANQGVHGISIGAHDLVGRDVSLEVPRMNTIVITARRVTRFQGWRFERVTVLRVETEGAYLEAQTTIPPDRLDPSPLARILPMYSIRFDGRIRY